VRNKAETIGMLGRSPARQSQQIIPPPLPPKPSDPPPRGAVARWVHGALLDNVGLKFLSIVLAATLFLLVNTDKDREITARVGVSYTLPDDKVLVSERLDEIRVTIKGPWRRLRRFDERELDRISLDLRRAPTGEVAITPDMIHLPAGLSVTAISPRTVRVAFDKRIEKVVELATTVTGHPEHGYVVASVKAVPATARVRGAERILAALSVIRTRELSLDNRRDSFTANPELETPDGVELVGSQHVTVKVQIDEELVTRKLPGLTVAVRGDGVDPARWAVSSQVEVTLTGALLAVEKARDEMTPVVKLAAGDYAAGKPREIEVTIVGLPPGVGVLISPERVKLTPIH
jgi:YbbR domain-containing protein